jgi:thiamine biosynthesis lipoprotein
MTKLAAEAPRTVHVEHCMGTVFSIDIRDPGSWDEAIDEAVAWLHRVDAVFSTYKDDSDISRLRRRELAVEDTDHHVASVLALCAAVETETSGYFTGSPGAELDPTGLVKGWAIEQASQLLRARGSHNHAVNGGGDIQLAGRAGHDRPWTVGISDPLDRTRVMTTVTGHDFAIATSGVAERGAHIINPYTAAPADGLASVTVVGRSLTRVDAYATAAFAMGSNALGWIEALPDHDGLLVFPDGTAACTPGFHHPAGPASSTWLPSKHRRRKSPAAPPSR